MAWFHDWQDRVQWVERNGLPVLFTAARVTPDGFMALYLEADEAVLPRSHVSRGFELHISLGFRTDYPDGLADVLCEFINAEWAGRYYVLDIEWVGKGGGAQIRMSDPIQRDPLIKYAHDAGHYGNGRWAKPRQLHISL